MRQLTMELPGPHPESETAIRRSYLSPAHLVTRPPILDDPVHGIDALLREEGVASPPRNTVHELMVYAAFKHKGCSGVGYRDVLDVRHEITENGKKWTSYELSPYHWLTTDAFEKLAWRLGERLNVDVGYGDRQSSIGSTRRILLFANSSHEWTMVAHACFSQSITVATIFTALGVDGLSTACRECEPLAIFTTAEHLPIVLDAATGTGLPRCVRTIILGTGDSSVSGNESNEVAEHYKKFEDLGWRVLQFADLVGDFHDVGHQTLPNLKNTPSEGDEAIIMYTSGTTGDPKGILLTHGAVAATVAGADAVIGPDIKHRLSEVSSHYIGGSRAYKTDRDDVDTYIAFLPTSHSLEFLIVHVLLFLGVRIGTARIRTLLGSTVRGCKPDIQELRPTVMAGVPSIWERIRKQVTRNLESQSFPVRLAFNAFLTAKRLITAYDPFPNFLHPASPLNRFTPTTVLTSTIDATVFSQIRSVTGGRLRGCLSGGAPVAPDTRQWIATVLCPMLVGYGLTENCAVATFEDLQHSFVADPSSVGGVLPHLEAKLVDFEEGSYFARDGKGEVWLRGPSLMREYFKRPDITAETITQDGWLKTGDIGQWLPDGSLMIVDRKKNLVKLSHGEYIAVERLESLYSHSSIVRTMCIYAHPSKDFAIAIVVPDDHELRRRYSNLLPREVSLSELCASPEVRNRVLSQLVEETAKIARLAPAEIVRGCILDDAEWTVDNGMMTPSTKVKRREVEKKFGAQIQKVYERASRRL